MALAMLVVFYLLEFCFRCRHEFAECLEKERALIAWIKANKIKVMNSGIKIAA